MCAIASDAALSSNLEIAKLKSTNLSNIYIILYHWQIQNFIKGGGYDNKQRSMGLNGEEGGGGGGGGGKRL